MRTMPTYSEEGAFSVCEDICKRASSTFFSSFSSLPLFQRKAVHAIYAFCRRVDDIADGDALPPVQMTEQLRQQTLQRDQHLREIHKSSPSSDSKTHFERLSALVDTRGKINQMINKNFHEKHDPVMVAMNAVIRDFSPKMKDLDAIIEGMEDDLFEVRCKTWDDLRAYCYKVASAVGLVLIEVYGYKDQSARLHAIDMGIQLQMINVLRDVVEDYDDNRVYVPIDVLNHHGISIEELPTNVLVGDSRWTAFVNEYVSQIRRHMSSGRRLLPLLNSRARVQPRLMCEAYEAILAEIMRRSGDVFSSRPTISVYAKIKLAFKTWIRKQFLFLSR
ncbi:MAG: hypothetical protein CMA84_01675 [Euryarchaeota archaeon]|nr:hypothetical protein [Euryarchaeota archaeon]